MAISEHIKQPFEVFDRAEVRQNSIVFKNSNLSRPERLFENESGEGWQMTEARAAALEKGARGEYNGNMSTATKRRVRKMLEAWLSIYEHERAEFEQKKRAYTSFRPTFVTLTYPINPGLPDNDLKRLHLNRFIIQAKNVWNVKNYFWKAEPQKNGRIHFHLIIDRPVSFDELNRQWCDIISPWVEKWWLERGELAVCDISKDEYIVKDPLKWGAGARRVRLDAGLPGATDIKSVPNNESIVNYLVKYMTKGTIEELEELEEYQNANFEQRQLLKEGWKTTGGRQIYGRVWGCSDAIRDLPPFQLSMWFTSLGDELTAAIKENAAGINVFADEHFAVYRINQRWLEEKTPNLAAQIRRYYTDLGQVLYHIDTNEGQYLRSCRAIFRGLAWKNCNRLDFLEYICKIRPLKWLKSNRNFLKWAESELSNAENKVPGDIRCSPFHVSKDRRGDSVCNG